MGAFSNQQEINDLPWGTPMPVLVRINGQMAQLRVKGSCSAIVSDAAILNAKAADLKALATQVRSILAGASADVLAEASRGVSAAGELAEKREQLGRDLLDAAKAPFAGMGLALKQVSVQAIEAA